jgi:hypothetical protein
MGHFEWGSRGRGFESRRPEFLKRNLLIPNLLHDGWGQTLCQAMKDGKVLFKNNSLLMSLGDDLDVLVGDGQQCQLDEEVSVL